MADTTNAGGDYRITITKSEKYRVARDGNPDNILGRTAGCRRLMYNRMLNATKAGTNKKGKYAWFTPNYTAFLDKENEDEAYLLDVPKQVYAQAFVDLQRARQNHANNPGHYGTPKYASKNRRESFRLCTTHAGKNADIRWIDSSHLRIPKIGAAHVIRHRNPPAGAIIKNVTFSMSSSGKWFVSVCYSYEISGITPASITKNLKRIGLDYSSPHLLIDDKGRTADQLIIELASAAHNGNLNGTPHYKHWYRENEALIARRTRELARKRNSLASKDGVPAIDGYEFAGWDTSFDSVTSDLTVTAVYRELPKPAQQPEQPAPAQPAPQPEQKDGTVDNLIQTGIDIVPAIAIPAVTASLIAFSIAKRKRE